MERAVAEKTQREFLRSVSEFSHHLTSAWEDIVKRAGIRKPYDRYSKFTTGPWGPHMLPGSLASASAAARFQELIEQVSGDLPILVKSAGDEAKIGRIAEKWTRCYDEVMREMLGIPTTSEADQLLARWRSVMDSLEGFRGAAPAGLVPGSYGTDWMVGWPLSGLSDAHRAMVRAWVETYEKTFGRLFAFPGVSPDAAQHKRLAAKALDAQNEYFRSLAAFQQDISAAAKKAVQDAIENIKKMEAKEAVSDTYERLCQHWLSRTEETFRELFSSEMFQEALARVMKLAAEARERMDAFVAEHVPLLAVAAKRDLDEARERVSDLEERLCVLERELQDLRRKLEAVTQQQGADR